MERITWVDALRGIAIVLMVIYHFFFDLFYYRLADIPLEDIGWVIFQRVIATLFLTLVGVSLVLSENAGRQAKQGPKGYERHFRRALKFGGVALLITALTWIYPHYAFIQFGIIHFIALSTLIAPFFFRFGRLNAVLGIIVIAMGSFTVNITTDNCYLFWLGLTCPSYVALDHYPIFPWFGLVLVGMAVGQKIFGLSEVRTGDDRNKKMPQTRIFSAGPLSWLEDKLAFLGRHSLLIYVVHQVVLVLVIVGYKAFVLHAYG